MTPVAVRGMGALAALSIGFGLAACGGPKAPPKLPDEESIHAGDDVSRAATSAPKADDSPDDAEDPRPPSTPGTPGPRPLPLVTNDPEQPVPAAPVLGNGKPGKPGKPLPKGERISPEDCTRMIDHYLELIVTSDPQFAELGADAKGMVRQIASQDPTYQKAQTECTTDVTRRKLTCAMAARTPAAWQACVK